MKNVIKSLMLSLLFGMTVKMGFTQNPIWSIPNKYLPSSFGPMSLPAPGGPDYNGASSVNSHNAMTDAQGNLKFFIVDGKIYNEDGILQDEMINSAVGYVTGGQETVMVPDPGNCQRYYIFTSHRYGGASEFERPYYAIYDLSLTSIYSGLPGSLVYVSSQNSFSMADMVPSGPQWQRTRIGFAATDIRTDGSRFVFMYDGRDLIYRFKLSSPSNISYEATITIPDLTDSQDMSAEVEIVNKSTGYLFACTYNLPSSSLLGNKAVFVATLNSSGAVISSFSKYFQKVSSNRPLIHGLEFSPNGDYLYVTHETNTSHTNPIEYINTSTQAITGLSPSGSTDFTNSNIEYSTDGKLYFAYNNRLATLSNPNTPGSAVWTNSAASITYSPSSVSMGGSTVNTYTLPDQIDGMNYTTHFFANQACCLINSPYTKTSYDVTTSATWQPSSNPFTGIIGSGNTVSIQNELRIPAGKTVTIQNMIFKFAPGAKVVIERGTTSPNVSSGKLILDNTKFTVDSACGNDMWLGVEVWGYSTGQTQSTNQTINKQGFLQVNNGSIIEHAYIGALAGKRDSPYDDTYSGGIIRTLNSIFRQNQIDAHLRPFTATNNLSYFTNTQFLLSRKLLKTNVNPLYRIFLQNVSGIKIQGCDVRNLNLNTTTGYTQNSSGYGIYSVNSNTYLTGLCGMLPCPSWDFSNIESFYYGVYAVGSVYNAALTFYTERTNFTNNTAGVLYNKLLNPTVIRSNFYPRNNYSQSYGLHMAYSTGYWCEGNYFQEISPNGQASGTSSNGIFVTNSDTAHNEIYRNVFDELTVGIQAMGINAKPCTLSNCAKGLQILCNTFYSNMFQADIGVTDAGISFPGRIDHQQGVAGAPPYQAGNIFSHTTVTGHLDIWQNPGVQSINYVHYPDTPRTPSPNSTSVFLTADAISSQTCASHLPSDGEEYDLIGELGAYDDNQNALNEIDVDDIEMRNILLQERDGIMRSMLRKVFMNEENSVYLDEIKEKLNNIDDKEHKAVLFGIELSSEHIDAAQEILNYINGHYTSDNWNIAASLYLDIVKYRLHANEQMIASWNESAAAIALDESQPMNMNLGDAIIACLNNTPVADNFFPLINDNNEKKSEQLVNEDQYIFNLYPNPTNGTITILIEDRTATQLELVSITGTIVASYRLQNTINKYTVDISHIPAGMYFVNLKNGLTVIEQRKLIKQ